MRLAMALRFSVGDDEDGLTLAAVIRRRRPELAWSRVRRLVERGKVSIGGEPCLEDVRRLQKGQEVVLDEHAPAPTPAVALIVFEDAHVVVIDKPAGISSVPYEKRERGTAMDLVREAWRQMKREATKTPLHVVHRIDKETSGLLMFAKTKLAERALQTLLRAHDIERSYLCVAHGRVTDARIESMLVTDRGDGLRGSARHPSKGGKRAVTHVRAVESLPRATLCEVRLETGKTHQIRIHLAERGHPLVGEKVYVRDYRGEPLASGRLLLHAATLGFVHPVTKKLVRLSSPLPKDFLEELEKLRR
jgi:23S rRNA pseudouridine1911/1915/1917 synthase